MALCLWFELAVGVFFLASFVVLFATEGTSWWSLGLFSALWFLVTAFSWVSVRRTFVMGPRVFADSILIVGRFKTRRLLWSEVTGVTLRELRFAGLQFIVPVIKTADGDSIVWDGRLRTLRTSGASAIRDALASEAARRAA